MTLYSKFKAIRGSVKLTYSSYGSINRVAVLMGPTDGFRVTIFDLLQCVFNHAAALREAGSAALTLQDGELGLVFGEAFRPWLTMFWLPESGKVF